MKTWLGRLLFLGVALALGLLGWLVIRDLTLVPRTSDAEIDAESARIATALPGRIIAIEVVENAAVTKGQPLLRLDPEPFRLRLEEAEAALAAALATLADARRGILSAEANARSAEIEVERARANRALAKATLDRLTPLEQPGYVSRQTVDQARTALTAADISLRQATETAGAARDAVATVAALEARSRVAAAQVALARRELAETVVYAPFAGKVTGLKSAAGDYVLPGTPLFTLIDTDSWTAVANFREGDLDAIRIGAPARVFVMIAPGQPLTGRVESIGWGVLSDGGIKLLGGAPYVARSLNWVRVAQRFPVRVRLEHPPERLMRLGASAVVAIDDRPRP